MLILFVFPNFIRYGFNYYYFSAALDFLFGVRFLIINYVFLYLLLCVWGVCMVYVCECVAYVCAYVCVCAWCMCVSVRHMYVHVCVCVHGVCVSA